MGIVFTIIGLVIRGSINKKYFVGFGLIVFITGVAYNGDVDMLLFFVGLGMFLFGVIQFLISLKNKDYRKRAKLLVFTGIALIVIGMTLSIRYDNEDAKQADATEESEEDSLDSKNVIETEAELEKAEEADIADPNINDRINDFEEYSLDLFYEEWSFNLNEFDADITISLPNSYNEYDPEVNARYNKLGDEYEYRNMLINNGIGSALDVAGDLFYDLPEINQVGITVQLHRKNILKIFITREEWDNKDLKLDDPSWESYLDSVEGFTIDLYI